MLNEQASAENDRPEAIPTPQDEPQPEFELQFLMDIRAMVADVFIVEEEITDSTNFRGTQAAIAVMNLESQLVLSFKGRLLVDSEVAFVMLDEKLAPYDMQPVFREDSRAQYIHVVSGRVSPEPRSWIPNLVLFVLTFGSVLYTGTLQAANELATSNLRQALQIVNDPLPELWRGLPYAISILLILGAHELGHYFAGRRHKLAVTLPYFIPFPFGLFGTFGAFIQLRQPMRNRKMLFDVGAAGPLAGLVFAIPILFIGLNTSPTGIIFPGGLVEGNSVFYALSKFLVFGEWLPNGRIDVFVNQLAWAGWTGLFVTGLNLMPIGQLDGGHVTYSLLGRFARTVYWPAILALAALTFLVSQSLLFILILLLLMGRTHAVPLDDITPLDGRRRALAVFTLVVFALVFVPVPVQQASVSFTPNNNGAALELAALELAALPLAMTTALGLVLLPRIVDAVWGWLKRR